MNSKTLIKEAKIMRDQADEVVAKAIKQDSPGECRLAAKKIASRNGKIAVFLGAGASKAFGWPLTNEILPAILDGLIDKDLFEDDRINRIKEDKFDRKLLKRTLSALCPGLKIKSSYLTKNGHRLPLVTSLLSMLDYSLATGQSAISGLTAEETRYARSLVERAIYEIVEHELEPTSPGEWPSREANDLAHELGKWLDGLRKATKSIGVITSNYDLAIEQVWGFDGKNRNKMEALAVVLGFPWLWACNDDDEKMIARPVQPRRRLYKLHGSTNWLRCGLCDRIHINPGVDVAIYAFQRKVDDNNECHCGHSKLEMQIVSPSFIRDIRSSNLSSVWQSALDWLREADDWIIIGYSFPDEDLNIRSLFARAFASGKKKPYVTAIQHGSNEQTRMRYEAFFPGNRLIYLTGGLETFLKNVA